MKNEIPAIRSNNEMTFVRLGYNEDIDLTIDLKAGTMTFEKVDYDEDAGDWVSKEITLEDVKSEIDDYRFCDVLSFPMTFEMLQTVFAHKLRI